MKEPNFLDRSDPHPHIVSHSIPPEKSTFFNITFLGLYYYRPKLLSYMPKMPLSKKAENKNTNFRK